MGEGAEGYWGGEGKRERGRGRGRWKREECEGQGHDKMVKKCFHT